MQNVHEQFQTNCFVTRDDLCHRSIYLFKHKAVTCVTLRFCVELKKESLKRAMEASSKANNERI